MTEMIFLLGKRKEIERIWVYDFVVYVTIDQLILNMVYKSTVISLRIYGQTKKKLF